jgi:hypothetical protein
VWLAVRASSDGRGGKPADVKWITDATGLSSRTIRDVVAKLVGAGLLRRTERGIEAVDLPKPGKRRNGRVITLNR